MENIDNSKIHELSNRLELLSEKQNLFLKEIDKLRTEINYLKSGMNDIKTNGSVYCKVDYPKYNKVNANKINDLGNENFNSNAKQKIPSVNILPKEKSNLEKFIGENLINKLGIVITIIGVAIGAKYSIENELISPLTRIILGYLAGLGLLGLSIKLKIKYENYSSVLMSGAMAIMYFITYFAYDLYGLIPQGLAFVIMVMFTIFTSVVAINYNKQVIALVGLIGAYAVPFLLSNNSGNIAILFSYITVINVGILAITIKKNWQSTQYLSFAFSWIIYSWWYISQYETNKHFGLALSFLSVFFIIFYAILLINKLIKKKELPIWNVILFLANSSIFYSIGLSILNNFKIGDQLLGAFTFCNALLNFIVALVIYRQKPENKNTLYLITGIALIFTTLSIPIQLDGNWVTLMWAGEAALLFWIGRTKGTSIYERLSYPLMILAFYSIIDDWSNVYKIEEMMFLFNINFLSSVLFILAFGFICKINNNINYTSKSVYNEKILRIISFVISSILIFTIYYTFVIEINSYFNRLYESTKINILQEGLQLAHRDYNLIKLREIWIINYTMFFVSILSFVNFSKIKNKQLGRINFVLIVLSIAFFIFKGLYILSQLQENYLEQTFSQPHQVTILNIFMRYITFAFVAIALVACYKYNKQYLEKSNFKMGFDIILHISILCIASSELIFCMSMLDSTQSDKLGLSILWGIYSLSLIGFGIWKRNKFLRLGAIVLFAITLIKLFFYDISHLNTISKTLVLLSLGVLLLIISFLYNKYKHIISEDNSEN